MPVYETAPVVLEIGTAYTKLGFAADSYPRFIIPTETYDVDTKTTKKLFDYSSKTELYERMVEFIQKLFFKYVLVSPKERKVVIVESVLCPTEIRETLAKVLFRHFEVLSVLFIPTHLVVLSTLAVETALVIDIGNKEATIIPVYCGVQVLHAWQAQAIAAEAVHGDIKRQLIECGVDPTLLTPEIVEDIKVRTCFVTTYERAQKYRNDDPPTPCPDVQYSINGKKDIKISGKLRETAFEVMFPEDNDHLGLPYIILDTIMKCPLDIRRELAENLFLIGGSTMVMGLMARLKVELLELLKSNMYKNKLFFDSVKFHTAPAKANFTAWLGGSIYGGTDLVQSRSLTREAYSKSGRVPDWSTVEENRFIGQ